MKLRHPSVKVVEWYHGLPQTWAVRDQFHDAPNILIKLSLKRIASIYVSKDCVSVDILGGQFLNVSCNITCVYQFVDKSNNIKGYFSPRAIW